MAADIAVLMASYNADNTVRKAVDSILANTAACRLFLIDDCSAVPVADVLGPLERVEIIRLERNQGLATALNIGLDHILARGYRYIARMDADDVAYPDRLAKQLAFMEAHPKVGVVAAAVRLIDADTGEMTMYFRPPCDDAAIRRRLFFNNCMIHPTWLMRAEVFARVGKYALDYPAAEDYEFIRRVARQFEVAVLPDLLLDYRVSASGISISKRRRQLYDRLRIQMTHFDPLKWQAWAGVCATLVFFLTPSKWIKAFKSKWKRGAAGGPSPATSAGPGPVLD